MTEGAGTIVVIEDDPNIADLVDMYLRRDGFRVIQASSGEAGLEAAVRERPRLVVVDIGLPDRMDGLEVFRVLRATSDVPVIILTARDSEVDRILGLELGADDYVTKPFSPRELTARVKAVLRRSGRAAESPGTPRPALTLGPLRIDNGAREVFVDEREVELTQREFDLLEYLVRHRGQVVSRDQLLQNVWDYRSLGETRTIEVHVAQLRKKLGRPELIRTVRGVGYKAMA